MRERKEGRALLYMKTMLMMSNKFNIPGIRGPAPGPSSSELDDEENIHASSGKEKEG